MNGFSEFLYSLRKENGMTQAELAERLGVTNKAVSKWETGEAMPETALLVPIADIFGVTVDELLKGRRTAEEPASAPSEDLPPREEKKTASFEGGHAFGKDKSPLAAVCGAVCGVVALLGVIAYLIVGFSTGLWHPFWTLAACGGLMSGVAGILFDMANPDKRAEKLEKGENPYAAGACGILMLVCIGAFLCLGAFLNLWHPMWILPACGALLCAVIAPLGEWWIKREK